MNNLHSTDDELFRVIRRPSFAGCRGEYSLQIKTATGDYEHVADSANQSDFIAVIANAEGRK